MKTPFTFIIVDEVIVDDIKSSIDYSEFIQKIKDIAKDEGLNVTVKQIVMEEDEEGIGKEEFVKRVREIDWSKIPEPKIKIACKDEKGEVFILEGTVQENGDIVCEPMTESRTIVGWSLKKEEVPLYKDKRFVTQECNETERLKRFGRKNSDGTVEWSDWQTY